jgi:CRP-like cAMP-binding protein
MNQKTKSAVQHLSSNELFKDSLHDELARIFGDCGEKYYVRGVSIIERHDVGNEVFFLVEGNVRIISYAENGRFTSFGQPKPGDYFGEMSAIDGNPRSATAVAETDVHLIQVSGESFREALLYFPAMSFEVLKKFSNIIRAGNRRIVDLSFLSSGERIAIELLELAMKSQGGSMVIEPAPTHEQIASNVGVTRETVARFFSRYIEENVIARDISSILIKNHRALENIAMNSHQPKNKI